MAIIITLHYSHSSQLQQYLKPGEYGLSIDTDVSLWIEFNSKPPLHKIFDFTIVNSSLHSEFDEFKRNTVHRDYSNLPTNKLLEYWNTFERNPPQPMTMLYGKPHHKLHYSEMDRLCEWVLNREKSGTCSVIAK